MLYACANLLQKKREIQNLSLNGFISEINELNRLGIYIEIYIYIYIPNQNTEHQMHFASFTRSLL